MPARRTAVTTAGLACAGALLLAGCASGAGAGAPTWVPKPSFQGEGGRSPDVGPGPQLPPGGGTGAPSVPAQPGAPSSSDPNAPDPAVVATRLAAPVGLTVLPDGSALVGERTTGRIVRVQPKPGQPVPTVRTLPGLDGSGDGGLLDLTLSPAYAQDGLVFAYVTTATDNRVVAFTLTGPVTPVVTGIPKGRTGNVGRVAFGSDGDLYVGTGDAGRPALAADPRSLAGKVLRVTDIGRPARDNPSPSSPVFTRGHPAVAGLCPARDDVLEVEPAGVDGLDEVNLLRPGADYGWPRPAAASEGPIATLPTAAGAPGGCAVLQDVLYVTTLDGRDVLSSQLTTKVGTVSAGRFEPLLKGKYGRLRTVVADEANGALWLTTSNRDGRGEPVRDDERVIRIVPSGGGGGSFPG